MLRALATCAAVLVLLGGCARSYRVELLNQTRSTITARIVVDGINGDVLETTDVAPGGFASMGPAEAPITERVRFEAVPAGDQGALPTEMVISPGLNEIQIETAGGWGGLRFDVLRLGGRLPEDIGP